jgi:uncharacterized protein with HEPN domain
MNEKVLKCLYDIKIAIDEIYLFLETGPKDLENYKQNFLFKRAIERNLEIIGEALNRILKDDPDFPIDNARRIIGLRNQIIHGYDSVSDENIWGIITAHLPRLKAEIEKLIK